MIFLNGVVIIGINYILRVHFVCPTMVPFLLKKDLVIF